LFDLYVHVDQNVYLEIVVVFAERIQHCLSDLNQSAIIVASHITVRGSMQGLFMRPAKVLAWLRQFVILE